MWNHQSQLFVCSTLYRWGWEYSAAIRQFPLHKATTNRLKLFRGSTSRRIWRTSCVINNPRHFGSMCLALPVSNNFRRFTVNGLQVLCLRDCGTLLPAGGLHNWHWWVFSTNKVSVVWALWLSGTSSPRETVVTAWLLEKGHSGEVADMKGGMGGGVLQVCSYIAKTCIPNKRVSQNHNLYDITK